MKKFIRRYYFITDAALSRAGNINDVEKAVRAGVTVVQYRNKAGNSKELYEEARILRQICRNILFLVNDRVDIALAAGADGVHIGQEDLPYAETRKILGKEKIIGLTVHNRKEAVQAQSAGADYVGVSPIFATGTKPDAGKAAGVNLISEVKKAVSIPVIAIGGINLLNAPDVVRAGADGLCAISAVVTGEDVESEIKKFMKLFEK